MTATPGSPEPVTHLPGDSFPVGPRERDSDRPSEPGEPAGSSSTATSRGHAPDSPADGDERNDDSGPSSEPVFGWIDADATWDDPSTALVLVAVALGAAGVMLSLLSLPGGITALAVSPAGLVVLVATGFVAVFVYVVAPLAVDPADSASYRVLRRTFAGVVLFGVLALGVSLLVATLPVALPAWGAAAVALAVGWLVAVAVVRPERRSRYSEYRLQMRSYEVWLVDGEQELADIHDQMPAPLQDETELEHDDVERKIRIAREKLKLASDALEDHRPELFLTHYNSATRDVITIKLRLATLRRRLDAPDPLPDEDDDTDAEWAATRKELKRRLVRAVGVVFGTKPVSPSVSTVTRTSRSTSDSRSGATSTTTTTTTSAAGAAVDAESAASRPFDWSQSLAQRFVFAAERDVDEESAAFVKRMLTRNGEIRSDLTDETLRAAAIRLHTHDERRFATLRTVERLLRTGTLLGGAGLVTLVLLAASGAATGVLVPLAGVSAATTFVLVALFGFLGAVTSSLFALKDLSADGFTNLEFSSPVINRDFMFMRFVVGALMGVVSYVALSSGVLTVVLNPAVFSALTGSAFVALTVAFAAGFVERFVTNAVEEFAANATAESTAGGATTKEQ